jgi:plasmid stability protein
VAQLVVRNLEASVKTRLKRRAARHGRSTEAEVRDILRYAVAQEDSPSTGLGTEIAAMFSKIGLRSPIRELHGRLKPPRFK